MFVRSPLNCLLLTAVAFSLATGSAFAQATKTTVGGGIDQRVPAIENQFLAQQTAEKTQQAARMAALLTIEKEDRKDAEDRATNLKQWLDLTWPAYEASQQK
jgi:hypothetical protein